jgi:hypothetical protein
MKKFQFLLVFILCIFYESAFCQESGSENETGYDYYLPDKDQAEDEKVNEQPANQGGQSSFTDKLFFGGGFGAGFGSYTFINVSPIIGYRVTQRLSVGMRLMYQYTTFEYRDINTFEVERYNGHDLGIGGFARFMVYGPVYLQAEYENLNYESLYFDGTSRRTSFDSFMAGGGIAQPIGRSAAFFLTALYNFSYQNFDQTGAYLCPYHSP